MFTFLAETAIYFQIYFMDHFMDGTIIQIHELEPFQSYLSFQIIIKIPDKGKIQIETII